MLGYHHWASLQLIAFCEGQPAAVLEASPPGVYGTIPATLSHAATAERAFLAAVLDKAPEMLTASAVETPLVEIAALVRSLAASWQAYAADPLPADMYRFDPRGAVRIATIIAQVMNHGSEHRAEVATILGTLGVQPPTIHPWAYEFALQAAAGGPPKP